MQSRDTWRHTSVTRLETFSVELPLQFRLKIRIKKTFVNLISFHGKLAKYLIIFIFLFGFLTLISRKI